MTCENMASSSTTSKFGKQCMLSRPWDPSAECLNAASADPAVVLPVRAVRAAASVPVWQEQGRQTRMQQHMIRLKTTSTSGNARLQQELCTVAVCRLQSNQCSTKQSKEHRRRRAGSRQSRNWWRRGQPPPRSLRLQRGVFSEHMNSNMTRVNINNSQQ
jgi:hypothetical protein